MYVTKNTEKNHFILKPSPHMRKINELRLKFKYLNKIFDDLNIKKTEMQKVQKTKFLKEYDKMLT